jgi:sugar O-acyltransferase (sialic acid O-acetyltransferase NeuD family)
MENLLLIGGGGHARDILGLVEDINDAFDDPINVAAILDDEWENTKRFDGCEIALVKGISSNLRLGKYFVICIGYPKYRKELTDLAISNGLKPYRPLIHPTANISRTCKVGDGSVVLGLSSFSPNVVVGCNSYVSHGVLLGHDAVVGDNVSIMPGASVSGDVAIGAGVLVGAGATILQGLTIGEGATVGAGSLVTKDVSPGTTVMGAPARERNKSLR